MALESLIAEHANETRTTRRLIERIPANQFEWRPHPKSFTAGGLASHIVECMGWLESIFLHDEIEFDPSTFKPYRMRRPPTETEYSRASMKQTADER